MAYDFNGTSQYLNGSAVVTDEPFTFSSWSSAANATHDGTLICIDAGGGNNGAFFRTTMRGDVANDPVQIAKYNGSTVQDTNSTAAFSANTWTHVAGVFSNNSSRSILLNGGSKATGTNVINDTAQTLINLVIGALKRDIPLSYLNGQVSECAIWNVALTDAEIASLAKGFKPTRIRPQSLVFYAPLLRNLQDVKGGLTITNNNSATVANHPRVY